MGMDCNFTVVFGIKFDKMKKLVVEKYDELMGNTEETQYPMYLKDFLSESELCFYSNWDYDESAVFGIEIYGAWGPGVSQFYPDGINHDYEMLIKEFKGDISRLQMWNNDDEEVDTGELIELLNNIVDDAAKNNELEYWQVLRVSW